MLTPLGLWIASDKVIETLRVRLRAVRREREVVILEVKTDTGQVNDGLDTDGPQLLGVTDARALEDER